MPPAKQNTLPDGVVIESLDEFNPSNSICTLIYGPTGSGKTQFAGSAGHEGRALFLNIAGGAVTLKNPLFRSKYPKSEKMRIVTIREDVNPATAEAYHKIQGTIEYFLNNHLDDFDTIIVDDMTALRRYATNLAVELNASLERSKTKNVFKNRDILIPAVQDFGTEMSLTEAFIVELIGICRQAEKHLICAAHERKQFGTPPSIGAEPPVTKTMPGFTGKAFPDAVTGLFDATLYATAEGGGENTLYRIRTIGSEKLTCGIKWGGIFKETESNLDFPTYLKKIQDGKLVRKVK